MKFKLEGEVNGGIANLTMQVEEGCMADFAMVLYAIADKEYGLSPSELIDCMRRQIAGIRPAVHVDEGMARFLMKAKKAGEN